MKYEKMTLDAVGDGALVEEFNECLAAVREDILDARKPVGAERSITLKITFKPSEEDTRVDLAVHSAVALAKRKKRRSAASLHNGEILQYCDTQEELPLGKVTTIRQQESEA